MHVKIPINAFTAKHRLESLEMSLKALQRPENLLFGYGIDQNGDKSHVYTQ